jgi:hypothetical protein
MLADIERQVSTPRNIAAFACAFVKLDLKMPASLQDALSRQAVQNMSTFDAKSIASSLWGFVKGDLKPAADLMGAFERRMEELMGDFNLQVSQSSLYLITQEIILHCDP